MLRAPDTQRRMQGAVKGVAVRGLNIGDVRPLQIPLPPLAEQHEIVRRLEAAFARLDAAMAAHAVAMAELDRLDQSLLARAFSGSLVSQDANDEPASVLLDRFRAEHSFTSPPRRSNRRDTPQRLRKPKRNEATQGRARCRYESTRESGETEEAGAAQDIHQKEREGLAGI